MARRDRGRRVKRDDQRFLAKVGKLHLPAQRKALYAGPGMDTSSEKARAAIRKWFSTPECPTCKKAWPCDVGRLLALTINEADRP